MSHEFVKTYGSIIKKNDYGNISILNNVRFYEFVVTVLKSISDIYMHVSMYIRNFREDLVPWTLFLVKIF